MGGSRAWIDTVQRPSVPTVLGNRNCTLRDHVNPPSPGLLPIVSIHARSPRRSNFPLSKFRRRSVRSSKPNFDSAVLSLNRLYCNTAGKQQPFSSEMSVWSNLFLMTPEGIFGARFSKIHERPSSAMKFAGRPRARAGIAGAAAVLRRQDYSTTY